MDFHTPAIRPLHTVTPKSQRFGLASLCVSNYLLSDANPPRHDLHEEAIDLPPTPSTYSYFGQSFDFVSRLEARESARQTGALTSAFFTHYTY
jgi:hypothetical protein